MAVYIVLFLGTYLLMLHRNRYTTYSDADLHDIKDPILRRFDNRTIVFTIAFIFLLSSLRSIKIGADTDTYAYWFHNAQSTGLGSPGIGNREIEQGYIIFQYLCSLITDNFQVFLTIVATIVTVVIGRFIKKYSVNPACSLFFFMLYFFQFYAVTGLRQTISAMLLILSYDFVVKHKLVPFLLIVALAFSFHTSAVIFVPFYFLANKQITKSYLGLIAVAFSLFFVFRSSIMHFLTNSFVSFTGDDHYAAYEYTNFDTLKYVLSVILLLIIAIYLKDEILSTNHYTRHYYNGALISLVLAPMGNIRVMLCYWSFIMLLYPYCMEKAKTKGSTVDLIVRYLVPLVLGVLMLLSYSRNNTIAPYMFFWN